MRLQDALQFCGNEESIKLGTIDCYFYWFVQPTKATQSIEINTCVNAFSKRLIEKKIVNRIISKDKSKC